MKKHLVSLEITTQDDISPKQIVELIETQLPTNTIIQIPNLETEMWEDVVIENLIFKNLESGNA